MRCELFCYWKISLLSFWLISILNVVSFPVKSTLDFILTNSWSAFPETAEPLWFTKVSFNFLLFELCPVELNYCRSDFFTLVLYFKFMLFVDVLDVWFLLFRRAFFVMRETSMCWLKRSLLNFNFLQILKVVLLFLHLFWYVSIWNIVLAQRNITWN